MTRQTSIKENEHHSGSEAPGNHPYYDQFSYMRIIATFFIIILHSLFASSIYFKDDMTAANVRFEQVFQNLLMWCVPVFLMITGVLLLDPDREIPLKKLFGKYIKRMLLTLVVFTFLFQLLDYKFGLQPTLFTGWIRSLFFAKSWAHMWYLYMIIGLYLMMPFYKLITRYAEKLVPYLILLLLIFTAVIPLFLKSFGFGIPTATVYPVYLFIGYWLYHHKMKLPLSLLLTIGCSVALIAVTTVFLGKTAITDSFCGYASILVVGQSAGIYSLLNRIPADADSWIRKIDSCTFGVYILHMIGIRWLMKIYGFNPYAYGPMSFILIAIVLFLISFFLTWLIRAVTRNQLL
jgi:surface polysaccharide O-acyltransferase-like enzyme